MTGNRARRSIGPKFSFTTSHCWAAVRKTKAGALTGEVMPEREAWALVLCNLRMTRTTPIRASWRTKFRFKSGFCGGDPNCRLIARTFHLGPAGGHMRNVLMIRPETGLVSIPAQNAVYFENCQTI